MGSDWDKDWWIYLSYALFFFGFITLLLGYYYLPSPGGTILQASALFLGGGGVSASILKY